MLARMCCCFTLPLHGVVYTVFQPLSVAGPVPGMSVSIPAPGESRPPPPAQTAMGGARLLRAPLVGLGGRPVPVRVDAGAAHEPVRAAADALVVGHEVGVRLRGVG